MFPPSVNKVREQNHQECQIFLEQTRIDPLPSTINSELIPENNIEIEPSKLIIHEHVYLLPEEVTL